MTTKTELRNQYVAQGWEVAPVSSWLKVSQVGSKSKYDVNAASPDNRFGTAQVIVTNDGEASETAVAGGFWVDQDESFGEAVRTYATGLENTGNPQIFAVSVTQVYEADEIALATAYRADGSQSEYVVKRRGGAFSPQLLA